ncbi:hypothetical protein SAMN05421848_1900 [Kushneria avicenniae]|uniref:Holin of 3TMs, for gene-transfer release n=1 Tax=Kushneria avicenniae TaxID=402385 RepID=A0A1I1KJM7_9GAMM|nr:hypothetical protein [Kushneria avicenniae]SFC58878.1 hypothetical protein SAMN05421848_1900 [Kushneria avicenniae]
MEWRDVRRRLADEAPEVARLFDSPVTCEAAGAIVAATLGCWKDASSRAVLSALEEQPELMERIRMLDVERIRLQLGEIDQKASTSQPVEIAVKGLFKNDWRAGVGWTLCGMLTLMSLAVCLTVIRDPDRIQDCVDIMTWLIFSASGILGINLHGNSVERRAMMEENHMGMHNRGSEAAPPRPREMQE